MCLPDEGPMVGLPIGVCVLLLRLLEQTKSSQDKRVDVILAFKTASGINLGRWYLRLWRLLPPSERQSDSFILAQRDGRAWTSHYYRHTHFYPLLYVLQSTGDPYFSPYTFEELKRAYHSFHTYKRTGRSVASRARPLTIRAATTAETIEHGRWRVSRTSLDMPLAYLDWSIEDRICVSQFCN
jgi:hypothetical protein